MDDTLLAKVLISSACKKPEDGGIGVFLGDLGPLSSTSVVEVCVMPIPDCFREAAETTGIVSGSDGLKDIGIDTMCIKYCSWHTNWLALNARQDTGAEVRFFKQIGIGKWEHASLVLADDRDSEPSS